MGFSFAASESSICSQKCNFLKSWITFMLLLQFIGCSNAGCGAPLECVPFENCSEALGNTINSYTLFPCGHENNKICCPPKQHASIVTENKSSLLPIEICGVSTEDRIIGGENASARQFPWMALLGYRVPDSKDLLYLCGGTIINYRYILTAAHCLKLNLAKLVSVRLGELNLKEDPDCEQFCTNKGCQSVCADPAQDYDVESIYAHEKFSSANLKNDIGLVRLKRNITFHGEYIHPLCLPIGFNFTGNEENKYMVAGWGKTDHYKTTGSSVLQYAIIQAVSLEDCNALQAEEVRPLDRTQLCAGSTQGKDSCKGDSGGPLMMIQNSSSRMYQVGIVSFGSIPCGGRDAPSVYTSVSSYIDWILKYIRE